MNKSVSMIAQYYSSYIITENIFQYLLLNITVLITKYCILNIV